MRSISSRFRLIRSDVKMDRILHKQIAEEGKGLYDSTALIVCVPGTPKARMDELVSKAWGGYPLWRVRAMRLGEAGPFSAAAICRAQDAYIRFIKAHKAKLAAAAKTEEVRQAATDRDLLRRMRDQHAAELQRLNARLAILDGDPS